MGVIGLIMLFVRPTMEHGGRYSVNNAIRTFLRGHCGRYRVNNAIRTSHHGTRLAL